MDEPAPEKTVTADHELPGIDAMLRRLARSKLSSADRLLTPSQALGVDTKMPWVAECPGRTRDPAGKYLTFGASNRVRQSRIDDDG